MQRFRLRSSTTAVQPRHGSNGEAITIPAGAVIASATPPESLLQSDRTNLITVEWEGKTVRMFLVDLLERGERVNGAGG